MFPSFSLFPAKPNDLDGLPRKDGAYYTQSQKKSNPYFRITCPNLADIQSTPSTIGTVRETFPRNRGLRGLGGFWSATAGNRGFRGWSIASPEAHLFVCFMRLCLPGGPVLGCAAPRGEMRRVSIRGTAHPGKRPRSLIENPVFGLPRPRPLSTSFQQIRESFRQAFQGRHAQRLPTISRPLTCQARRQKKNAPRRGVRTGAS